MQTPSHTETSRNAPPSLHGARVPSRAPHLLHSGRSAILELSAVLELELAEPVFADELVLALDELEQLRLDALEAHDVE